jgi:phage tail-like protein
MVNLLGRYPQPAFYFTVFFGMKSGVIDTSFQEVSGIGPEIETEEIREGGENRFFHRLPKAKKHPRLVLKRGVALIDSPLVHWCKGFLEGDFSQPFVPSQVTVCLLNEISIPVATWSFAQAYPVHWEVESFNSTKNEVAIEKIELSYSYSTREA